MCGLVGVIGDVDAKSEKAFSTLLILDSLRGIDSTGAAIVNRGNSNECTVVKAVGNPYELLGTVRFEKALRGVHRVLIGHNRFATQGKVTNANAHPFDFDDLVGAHNGTLHNKYVLDSAGDFTVDSQALYHYINKFSVAAAIKNLSGAWALTWWNKKEGSMNFLRNKERPLYLCNSADGKQMFWASEEWMLTVALSRHDIKIDEPFLLEEDAHLKMVINPNGAFGEETCVEVKSEFVPFQGTHGWTNTGGHGSRQGPINQQSSMFAHQTASSFKKEEKESVDDKKNGGTIINPGISSVSSNYSGKKGRVLKAIYYHSDSNGGGYFQAFDKEYPRLLVRLYVQRDSIEMDWLGKEFVGDISEKPSYTDGKLYHKVIHCSTKLYVPQLTPPESVTDNDGAINTFMDKSGKLISEEEWGKRYGFCCVCSGNVDPRGVFRFARQHDETLCSVCMEDHSIIQYMGL